MAINTEIKNKIIVATNKEGCSIATPIFCSNLKPQNLEKNAKNLKISGKNPNLENSLKSINESGNLPTTTTTTTTNNINNIYNPISDGFRLPLATCSNPATYKTENSLIEHLKELEGWGSVLKNHVLSDINRCIILKILQNNIIYPREISKITNIYYLKIERNIKKLQKNNIIRPLNPYEYPEAVQKAKKNLLKNQYISEYHTNKLKFYTLTDFARKIYEPMQEDIKNNCKYTPAIDHPAKVQELRKKEENKLLSTCYVCKQRFPFQSLTYIPAIKKYMCQKCTLKRFGATDDEIKRYNL